MAERPGIMVYFDKWEPILKLSDAEIGGLFRVALLYGKYSEIPELTGIHDVLWGMIRPDLDRDDIQYHKNVWQKKYAVYCREAKKNGEAPMPREEWDARFDYQAVSCDNGRYPISTPSSETASSPKSSSIAEAEGKGSARGMQSHANACERIQSDTAEYEEASEREKEERFERQRQSALEKLNQYGEA